MESPGDSRAPSGPSRRGGGRLFLAGLALVALLGLGLALRQGWADTAWVGPRLAIAYEEDLDLGLADRRWELPGLLLEVGLARPVAVLEASSLWVRARRTGGGPATGLELGWELNMDMDMGHFRVPLAESPSESGFYQGPFMLPVCAFGGHRWYLRLRVADPGGPEVGWSRTFILDVP